MKTLFELEPIDAVITWVDGADPHHKAKLHAHLEKIGGQRPHSANSARFHNVGEIEYCVVSLLRFAPWVRTIFIVCDEQQPDFMSKLMGTPYAGRVKIVDHKVIFAGYERYLPSFNSMSISSLLWRIPGLSERFLYLNDDFALIRRVEPSDFYRDGKVVLRGDWKTQTDQRIPKIIYRWMKKILMIKTESNSRARVRFIGVQENSAKIHGFHRKVFQLEHNPHPWLKSVWKSYAEKNPDMFEKNFSHQLRSAEQFVPEGFSAHYLLAVGAALIDNNLKTLQLKPGDQALLRIINKIALADRDNRYAFVCVQSLESASQEVYTTVVDWLQKRIGSLAELMLQASGDQTNNL